MVFLSSTTVVLLLLLPSISLVGTTTAFVHSFTPPKTTKIHHQHLNDNPFVRRRCSGRAAAVTQQPLVVGLAATRYGPPEEKPSTGQSDIDFLAGQAQWEEQDKIREMKQRQEFESLLEQIISTDKQEHLPSLLTRNIDLVLNMRGYEGVRYLKDALQQAKDSKDEERLEAVQSAVEYILTFVEEFVENAKSIDDENKNLLGKIIRTMMSGNEKENGGGYEEEVALDELLVKEREKLTPGFLRHIEGECNRIEGAPRMSRESAKLLQTMRIIQARVVEELGKDLGEAALVLGQLLGYDNKSERLAVLDAGLTVRGITFAEEMVALTEEALEGFQNVMGGGVDPGLVKRVTEIDGRIRRFIEREQQ